MRNPCRETDGTPGSTAFVHARSSPCFHGFGVCLPEENSNDAEAKANFRHRESPVQPQNSRAVGLLPELEPSLLQSKVH